MTKVNKKSTSYLFTFEEFLAYIKDLRKRRINVSKTGQKCVDDYTTNWHNLQGHVKQAFYGVQRFLQENPLFIARIAQTDVNSLYPLEGNIRRSWKRFLNMYKSEKGTDYDIGVLYNQTPTKYGGRTVSGGGGITYIRRSFPIVARMMLSGSLANPNLLADPEGESSEEEIRTRKETILRRIRDTEKVRELKEIYDYSCQVCTKPVIQIGPGNFYAEGHHLRPLGKPHNGEDLESNIIILCPNHHVMFDRCVMAIDPQDGKNVVSKFNGKKTKLLLRHKLKPDNIEYHYRSYLSS